MIPALGWRLAQAGMVAVLVAILSFLMMRALPGDMVMRIAGARFGYDNITAQNAEIVRAQLGDPAGVGAFLGWFAGLVRGDLGVSLVSGLPVSAEIGHQLGATATLAGMAIVLSLLIGPPLGLLAGLRPGGAFDRLTLLLAASLKATPQFLLGLVLIVVVAIALGLLPAAGHGAPQHLILPALTLALGLAAASTRITREALVQARGSDWWRFARWKGLSEGQVLRRHGLRHVAVPVLTLMATQFVALMEGVVVVETIFGWPGIGHALVHAVFHRDVPMVQGTALVMGLGFVLVNALADIAVRLLDPREVRR
ncbi:ABC transporter permease [Phaeovulum vinaykumarii]|uniref:Peptide/nickel transport system permease protein n=1 Tax=Phaeovulum vinaykumarii TaxID=407234 RepID=A0A1N7M0F5_9RHOB|nr:ABC transporter permease [Phaeovulum vinaykumarii]SIS79554.1 peptide/nickel transport system permease protein [Phaeovulum vinaykumarii]SOC09711.1 peptide/nickel transport system permease protein [Phaeovulum vinaykumarii]